MTHKIKPTKKYELQLKARANLSDTDWGIYFSAVNSYIQDPLNATLLLTVRGFNADWTAEFNRMEPSIAILITEAASGIDNGFTRSYVRRLMQHTVVHLARVHTNKKRISKSRRARSERIRREKAAAAAAAMAKHNGENESNENGGANTKEVNLVDHADAESDKEWDWDGDEDVDLEGGSWNE